MKLKIAVFHDGVNEVVYTTIDIKERPGIKIAEVPYLQGWELYPGDTITITEAQ